MVIPKLPSDELLRVAAELRAGGAKWVDVAAAVHRTPRTVQRWPQVYASRWGAALRTAERQLVREASAEAVLKLRKLLRGTDEKVARDAAKSLIDLYVSHNKFDRSSDEPGATLSPDAARFAAFLDGHTDDELARLVAAVESAAAQHDLPEPVRADGAA